VEEAEHVRAALQGSSPARCCWRTMSGGPIALRCRTPLARVADQVDKFVIPMPFRASDRHRAACYVPRVTDAPSLARLQSQMEQELNALRRGARGVAPC